MAGLMAGLTAKPNWYFCAELPVIKELPTTGIDEMEDIFVENIKCGGCANGIMQNLNKIDGVLEVAVNVEAGKVTCQFVGSENDLALAKVKQKLQSMGYPEVGSVAGIKATSAKAKSFVSCAVGKMSDSSST